jgi:1-phosphatidylinositol phosphodiesterase
MSIPGTHDTMALYGSDMIETQSVDLHSQLLAGIRILDIRFVCDTLIMCLQFTTGLFTRKSVLGVSWIFVIRF